MQVLFLVGSICTLDLSVADSLSGKFPCGRGKGGGSHSMKSRKVHRSNQWSNLGLALCFEVGRSPTAPQSGESWDFDESEV